MRIVRGTLGSVALLLLLLGCGGGGSTSGPGDNGSGGGGEQHLLQVKLSGLAGGTLGLTDGRGHTLFLSANGTSELPAPPTGAVYQIEVFEQPDNQVCEVAGGSGTFTASVTVAVSCHAGLLVEHVGSAGIGQVLGAVLRQPADWVAAELDEAQLAVDVQGRRLLFVVPELASGSHILRVYADGREFHAPLQVHQTDLPMPAQDYLAHAIDEVEALLQEWLAEATEADQAFLAALQNQLDQGRAVLTGLMPEQLLAQARLIHANGLLAQARLIQSNALLEPDGEFGLSAFAVRSAFSASACMQHAQAYPVEFGVAIASAAALAASLWTQQYLAAVLAAAVLYRSLKVVASRVDGVTEDCFGPYGELLLPASGGGFQVGVAVAGAADAWPRMVFLAGTASTVGALTFNHDVPREFQPIQPERLDPMIGSDFMTKLATLQDLQARFNGLLAALSGRLHELLAGITGFEPEREELVEAAALTVTAISDPRIAGEAYGVGEALELSFWFKPEQMPAQPVAFQFSLQLATKIVGTYSARLNPANPPRAFAGAFATPRNQPYEGQLQGEFTDRYALLSLPQHGSVTLDNALTGAFTYTPEGTEGVDSDEFSFIAINRFGSSEPATVEISLRDVCAYAGIYSRAFALGDSSSESYVIAPTGELAGSRTRWYTTMGDGGEEETVVIHMEIVGVVPMDEEPPELGDCWVPIQGRGSYTYSEASYTFSFSGGVQRNEEGAQMWWQGSPNSPYRYGDISGLACTYDCDE